MKSYLRSITLVCLSCFLFQCQSSTQPTPDPGDSLLGTWQETFTWTDITDCVTIGWDTHCAEYTQTTTLTVTTTGFIVTIRPPESQTYVSGDSVWSGPAPDTVYTGITQTSQDTVFFQVAELDTSYAFRFTVHEDSLRLRLVGMQGPSADEPIRLSIRSFVWGWAFGKTHGTFIRSH